MQRILQTVFSLFICLGSFTCFGQSGSERIDSLLRSIYDPRQPGAVVGIVSEGKIFFLQHYGLRDLASKKPVQVNTLFNIGSLTKQFTAYAIMTLVNEKKLSLHDSLEKFFPDLRPAIGRHITIEQMLSHCSGLPDHYAFTDTNIVRHASDRDVLVALKRADTLLFTPGTHYRYSNTAYCLLGLLLEKITGLSYASVLQQTIFQPLHMTESSVIDLHHPLPSAAKSYTRNKAGVFSELDADQSIFFSTEADGGIYTSMSDYLRWCICLEQGCMNRNIVSQTWIPRTVVDSSKGLSYGFGWFLGSGPGMVYHTGSNGGFRSVSYLLPAQEYAVAIFSNRDDIDLEDIVMRINHLMNVSPEIFIKSLPLESFNHCWPKFAPCKETPSFLTSSNRSWIASVTD